MSESTQQPNVLESVTKKAVIETHGKVETTEPTLLEQVWGYNELARYGTLKETEYLAQLNEMNRSDMETHARRLGVLVVESTARLRDNLVREFRQYVSLLRKPAQPKSQPVEVTPEVAKILAEGR